MKQRALDEIETEVTVKGLHKEKSMKRKPAKQETATRRSNRDGKFTAEDLAEACGLPSAFIARQHLRKSGLEKPEGGWAWASEKAAKAAIAAVRASMDDGGRRHKASDDDDDDETAPRKRKAAASDEEGSRPKKKSAKKK